MGLKTNSLIKYAWRSRFTTMQPTAKTASSEICDRIRDDIVAGALPFGSRLTLEQLATRYATGHMPIREALRQRLAHEQFCDDEQLVVFDADIVERENVGM